MLLFNFLIFIILFPLIYSSNDLLNKTTNQQQKIKIKFEPFHLSKEYRCGSFLEQQGPQKDPAMKFLHLIQNEFIKLFSEPFLHKSLLSDDALLGKKEAWENSLMERRDQWFQFERWWIILSLFLILIPPIFAILYLFIRCCMCLCKKNSEKSNRESDGDKRCDWLRRGLLNIFIGIFVLITIFCSAVMLLSTQYAQHGLDELPTRLHYCANDLLIYRGETIEQIRKLLRDDFIRFNQTLHSVLDRAGEMTIERLKQLTGVEKLDKAVSSVNNIPHLLSTYKELQQELGKTLDSRHSLQIKLLKLKQAQDSLTECEKTSQNGEKIFLCHQAKLSINPLLELAKLNNEDNDEEDGEINVITGDWQLEQKSREISSLLPEQIPIILNQIEQIDIEKRFAVPLEGLQILQNGIQKQVDERKEDAEERLRLLDKTLQLNYEQISSAIKSIDLSFLDENIIDPMMKQRERFKQFIHYGWVSSLIISGLFSFISLSFLLGLCFGCCGRRPNEYDDDDCCVRSTGSNFFGCSIWLSLALISIFGLISAFGMLIGSNSQHLICNPLNEPLTRPDMISFVDRLITLHGLDKQTNNKNNIFQSIFTNKRRPIDYIRGCSSNKTIYLMLELDKKFNLINGGVDNEYEEMANSIRQTLLSGRLLEKASLSGSTSSSTSFSSKWNNFSKDMRIGIEELGQIEIPEWKENILKDFCSQKIRFQLEGITSELRHLRQKYEEKQNGQQIEELETVLHFLEELRPDTVQVRALIENICSRLEQFRFDVFSLKIDSDTLLKDFDKSQIELGSEQKIVENLHFVALNVSNEFADLVKQYGEHINKSMNNEVTSCNPLTEIAIHTREAICDYTLDPINSLWLSLGLGLLLLLPIIILASMLNPLYKRTNSYSQYNVPSITDCQNENHFQTDIYNMDSTTTNNNYNKKGNVNRIKENNTNGYNSQHYHHGNYQQPSCTQITSPYASSYAGYGYHGLGPPIYMGTNRS